MIKFTKELMAIHFRAKQEDLTPHTISPHFHSKPGSIAGLYCFYCLVIKSEIFDDIGIVSIGVFMKRVAYIITGLIFSSYSIAGGELMVNNSPLTLILNDGNQANVSTCTDFVALRMTGEQVKELPGLSDPDFHDAKSALFGCWLNAYVIKHGMMTVNAAAPDLPTVLKHFPANAAFVVSDYEAKTIQRDFSNKTIQDFTPDLTYNDDQAVSTVQDTGYRVKDYYSYLDNNGNQLNVLALVGYSLSGTAGSKTFWRIDDTSQPIWKVTMLDENSPL